jgi:hypothetical protein
MPALGRFLQTDPVGYADDMNMYVYVGNNPINWTDSTGLCPSCISAAASVFFGGVIRGATGGDIFDLKSIALVAAMGFVGTGLVSKATNMYSIARWHYQYPA